MSTNDTEQTACTQAEPQAEHEWLQQLVGEWEYVTEAQMEPGSPPERFTGTESVRSLGGLWILAEGQGVMPGGDSATMILTLGYDPHRKRYVGTWVGSMMTHLWVYEGGLDADGKTLTLDCEGPDMTVAGKMARYRDVIGFESDGRRTLTSHVLGADGTWQTIMTTGYRKM